MLLERDEANTEREAQGDQPDFGGAECTVVGLVRRFVDQRCVGETCVSAAQRTLVSIDEAQWEVQFKTMPVAGRDGCRDIHVTFTLRQGAVLATGVAVAVNLADWSADHYVLAPAAAYAGNRFAVHKLKYPPLWRSKEEFLPDMPTTLTDVPRLTAGPGTSKLELTAADMTTPLVGYFAPESQRGGLILTQQQTRLGNIGMTVEESPDRATARILISAPCVREMQYHFDAGGLIPGGDRAADWKAGDSVSLRLRVWLFDADGVQSLFDRFCAMRKDFAAPAEHRPQLPWSAAWAIQEDKYNRENWDEPYGYYRVAVDFHTTFATSDRPLCFLWQAGWVGGAMVTLPLLFAGTEVSQQRAWRNLEMLFERTAAPSGFIYGAGDGENFYGDAIDRPHPHHMHMVRKSADVLFWAIKQFDLLRRQCRAIPERWTQTVARLADAFVGLWDRYGQFGQFVDIQTGDMLIGGSTAGGGAPAGLALASTWFGERRYLEVAQAAAQRYYQTDVCHAVTTGGPGEILSAPDSESAYALFESFVILYEVTRDKAWLTKARAMLRQLASWVVSYDFVFPAESVMTKAGVRTTGAVWANVQNKHAAPAFCTTSGDALLKYWRASGDALALDLLRDIARGLPQYLARADRRFNDRMQPGWMCERVNMSDWEGPQAVGGNLFGSCWAEVSLMAQSVELPGLYVQPDTGFFCILDHIEAECLGRDSGMIRLKLTNPTKFPATIRVLCESSAAAGNPLGLNALYQGRTISIPAGQSVIERFE